MEENEDKIVKELASAIYATIEPLLRFTIEQRLRQVLPIIKSGLMPVKEG